MTHEKPGIVFCVSRAVKASTLAAELATFA